MTYNMHKMVTFAPVEAQGGWKRWDCMECPCSAGGLHQIEIQMPQAAQAQGHCAHSPTSFQLRPDEIKRLAREAGLRGARSIERSIAHVLRLSPLSMRWARGLARRQRRRSSTSHGVAAAVCGARAGGMRSGGVGGRTIGAGGFKPAPVCNAVQRRLVWD